MNSRGVSPVIGVMLMLVATVILAAVVTSYSGGLASEESKAPQISISIKAKESDRIIITHEGGDPINLGAIEVRTFIPEGLYKDVTYKVDTSDNDWDGLPDRFTEIGNGNKVLEPGESLEIKWNDAFATGGYGIMAPKAGEKLVVELYEKEGNKPIAKGSTIVRP